MAKEFHLCRLRRRLTLPKIARSIMTRNAPTQIGASCSINADRPKGKCLEAQIPFPRLFPATASLAHTCNSNSENIDFDRVEANQSQKGP
jgi:hypothetical protein